jgi:hypothetical protein
MITVFSGDREFTRNVYFFKKAPDGMENNVELPIEFFSYSNSNNSNQIHDSNSNQNNHQIIEIDTNRPVEATTQQNRRSTRVSSPIERYVAEPASGLRNRQPKRK